ncbi:hypothetical protein LTR70_006601 [Exophiala xenobiotica]|uniref:Uncharacterized protein n=1 Tax=Lithohypha guttulata TaxID=1690604 RepID=A0ABR0K8G5_9EURO|nr:hypothetical protein LTR24_005920 [Lithohypha guttulata]KAK5315859.1 hypothetical protein LTR70_006601 [Exophiala xenobiotica]
MQGLLLFTQRDVTLLTTIEKTGVFDTMFSAPAKKAAYLILANVEQVAALQNTNAYTAEAFLTAKALSIKIFLEAVLCCTTDTEEDFGDTAVQLMEILQEPEQQLCSSLALCSSLESVFWQTMMGAIAAPNARTRSFYMSRLGRITIALALTSWYDALVILQRFFWVPSIFSTPGYQILSEILYSQGRIDI